MYTANRQELVFFEHMNFLTSTVVGRRPCPSTLPENVGQTLIHISIVASRKGGIDRTHVSTQLTKFTVTKNWVAQKKKKWKRQRNRRAQGQWVFAQSSGAMLDYLRGSLAAEYHSRPNYCFINITVYACRWAFN